MRNALDATLAAVFAAGLGFTAYMIQNSWGDGYWQFDLAAGLLLALLALLRRRGPGWTALAGVLVAAAAVVVAAAAGLPHEPAPVAALALAVLTGSAVRTLPAVRAGAVALGGLAVVAGAWVAGGFIAVAVLATLAWLAGAATGLVLRSIPFS